MTDRYATRDILQDAPVAAFPLGGIGTGNVSLGARGELRDWEIFNGPGKGNKLPFTFFALRAAGQDTPPFTTVLESRLQPPHDRPNGYEPGDTAGLPRLHDSRLRGEYPFAWIDFFDDELPLAITLEAFTPFVPLDAAESGLPTAVFRFQVRNTGDSPLDVTVAGSLFNAVGLDGFSEVSASPKIVGQPTNVFREQGSLRGIYLSSSLSADHLKHGTMALLTSAPHVTVKPDWPGYWPACESGLDDFWRDLCEDGRLHAVASRVSDSRRRTSLIAAFDGTEASRILAASLEQADAEAPRHRVGSLGIFETLEPGTEHVFEFVLAWHFPNRPRAWLESLFDNSNADQIVRNHYALRFSDAWDVGRHLLENLPVLERTTRDFHGSLYRSTLPTELVDAAASNLANLRSTTCFRLEDGTFAAWEGTFDQFGSCGGSCTHVWNYAQAAAFLFPELERSMRRVEFGLETDSAGRMNFRTNRIFGAEPRQFLPAADGQLGTIVRLYREWKFSGDDGFLLELWPNASKALDFAFDYWDSDGDSVLDASQHNTYDVEFYGVSSHTNSIFYAALRAGAEMAEYVGDTGRAERYRTAAAKGAEAMDGLTWNGEYYAQHLDDLDAYPYQYGSGCLADQVFGQLLAHIVGLGHVLPVDHVRQALASVHRYNFRPVLGDHESLMRTYALCDEGGLVLCSWPKGGRPIRPFYFCDEVWAGVEYQVAAHMLYEGLVDEALEIVRSVRNRHDGYRRSPWNEAECGNHYARSMASWALLLGYSGFRYDAQVKAIGFTPRARTPDFRCFFSTGAGWGDFSSNTRGAELEVRYGSLALSQVDLQLPAGLSVCKVCVNGRRLIAKADSGDIGTTVTFDTIALTAGDVVRIAFTGSPPG